MASLIISIIALVFSATSIVWNVYQYYDRINRKLVIKNKGKFIVLSNNQRIHYYCFDVTNVSQVPVLIDKYEFYLNTVTDGSFFAFDELIREKRTPIKLDAGHKDDFSVKRAAIYQIMDEHKANMIKLVLIDTLGKRYEGAWIGRLGQDVAAKE